MSLARMVKGFNRFRKLYFKKNNRYKALVNDGQSPEVLFIACSDSRNDPAMLTLSKPGDIFVVRNVAAIVPPYEPDDALHSASAAIEFAVKELKVKDIVVLGHSSCGGVGALMEQGDDGDFEFLSQWMSVGSKARSLVKKKLSELPEEVKIKALEHAVILTSLKNLMTFPWVAKAVREKELSLHGWYFDMSEGRLLSYNFLSEKFTELKDAEKGLSEGSIHSISLDGGGEILSLENLIDNYTLLDKA